MSHISAKGIFWICRFSEGAIPTQLLCAAESDADAADEQPGSRKVTMPREEIVTVGGRTRRRALACTDVDVGAIGASGTPLT